MDKVNYVKSRPHESGHSCHWPNCDKEVKPALFMCKTHWFKLPKHLRDRIWEEYEPGQEVSKEPTVEYMYVVKEVMDWIQKNPSVR